MSEALANLALESVRSRGSLQIDDHQAPQGGMADEHPVLGQGHRAGLLHSPSSKGDHQKTLPGTVVIHDLAGDDRMVRLSQPGHQPRALAFSPDGRWAVTGGWDCTVRVWDPQSGALRHTLKSHTDRIVRLRFARLASGVHLFSAGLDGTVKLWDMASIERQMGSP